MTDNDELVRRFRSEIPPPDEAAWAAVRSAVAREIAAELEPAHKSARMPRRRAPRLLAVGLAALALTGAVAYGATTLIGVGSPAPNPPAPFPPSNIKLLGLRVADPAGGPPWGIRLALSQVADDLRSGVARSGDSRSGVAIQIGRIRAGQMGFIGEDNVFHDDNLFHVAGPNSALITPADYPIEGTPQKPDLQSIYHFALTLPGVASAYEGCSTIRVPALDRQASKREERLLEQSLATLRAEGASAPRYGRRFPGGVAALRMTLAKQQEQARERAHGVVAERSFATCPGADLRTLVFGFAGPSATSIGISGFGVNQTEQLRSDDDGFYLFVLSQHWNYGSKFQDTVTCGDGRTFSGVAAPGTPDPPYCRGGG
jgi:hypothetical protein